MSQINVIGSGLDETSPFYQILMTNSLTPGDEPSYQICKLLYLFHPLGKKVIDSPISRAMYRRREIIVKEAPESVIRRYEDVWDELQCDYYIADCYRLSRIYGISSLAVMPQDDISPDTPLQPVELWSGKIKFNSFDPLNTAGSMVGVLDPNNPDFLKYSSISVAGQSYAPSRTHIQLYENPVYLSYTTSAYGYVGRSVFNRALYPMQSFIQSMIADNLMMIKSGVLVAKLNQPGSIIDKTMAAVQNLRLNILKQARTGNTVSVKPDEDIQSLDLHNLNYQDQRKNILENIALSLDMPPSFLTGDSLSQGFGEGEQDAKLIASYLDRVRLDMKPIYDFVDMIVQHVAWSPDYFATLQSRYSEFAGISYDEWFSQCRRSFTTCWPEALEPTKKERTDHQKNQYQSVLEVYNTIGAECTGENKARMMEWIIGNLNEAEDIFPNKLSLDTDEIGLRSALGLDEPPEDNDETSPQVPTPHAH